MPPTGALCESDASGRPFAMTPHVLAKKREDRGATDMSRPDDEYPNDERKYPNEEPECSERFQVERGLSDLSQGRWTAAEQRFPSALTQATGRRSAQALAVIGVAQSRLFGRRDGRGAFAMLQTLFGQEPRLTPDERARPHVVTAFLAAGE